MSDSKSDPVITQQQDLFSWVLLTLLIAVGCFGGGLLAQNVVQASVRTQLERMATEHPSATASELLKAHNSGLPIKPQPQLALGTNPVGPMPPLPIVDAGPKAVPPPARVELGPEIPTREVAPAPRPALEASGQGVTTPPTADPPIGGARSTMPPPTPLRD